MSFLIRRKPDEKSEPEIDRCISNCFYNILRQFYYRFLPAVGMTNRRFLDSPKVIWCTLFSSKIVSVVFWAVTIAAKSYSGLVCICMTGKTNSRVVIMVAGAFAESIFKAAFMGFGIGAKHTVEIGVT